MKALVLTDYQKMDYRDVPDPVIAPNEVLVHIRSCGICGSDIHGYDGSTGRRRPPIIMGHEASGVIEKLGADVTGWQIGDRVTFDSTIYCGHCDPCMHGEINLCENRRVLGCSCEEYKRDGCFAEYAAIPQHILYKLPENVSFDQAAMVEPLSIAFHAANLAPHPLNASAAVVGAGKIGLLLIQTLRAFGFGKIYALKASERDFDLIRSLGADECMISNAEAVSQIMNETGGKGVDFVFEAAGNNAAFNTGVDICRKGGTIILVGNSAPKIEMPLQKIVTRQIRLQGSCASAGEYDACLELISRGKINVDSLIAAAAPLSEGAEWFEKLYHEHSSGLKVILNP